MTWPLCDVWRRGHDPRPRVINGNEGAEAEELDPGELLNMLDNDEPENEGIYHNAFLQAGEDHEDFWGDENIAGMLGDLELEEEDH